MLNPTNLVGKPLTVTLPDGTKKVIGKVVAAKIVDGKLFTASEVDLSA